jgi:hypothetical protein
MTIIYIYIYVTCFKYTYIHKIIYTCIYEYRYWAKEVWSDVYVRLLNTAKFIANNDDKNENDNDSYNNDNGHKDNDIERDNNNNHDNNNNINKKNTASTTKNSPPTPLLLSAIDLNPSISALKSLFKLNYINDNYMDSSFIPTTRNPLNEKAKVRHKCMYIQVCIYISVLFVFLYI